jgi:hypothetical protein
MEMRRMGLRPRQGHLSLFPFLLLLLIRKGRKRKRKRTRTRTRRKKRRRRRRRKKKRRKKKRKMRRLYQIQNSFLKSIFRFTTRGLSSTVKNCNL